MASRAHLRSWSDYGYAIHGRTLESNISQVLVINSRLINARNTRKRWSGAWPSFLRLISLTKLNFPLADAGFIPSEEIP